MGSEFRWSRWIWFFFVFVFFVSTEKSFNVNIYSCPLRVPRDDVGGMDEIRRRIKGHLFRGQTSIQFNSIRSNDLCEFALWTNKKKECTRFLRLLGECPTRRWRCLLWWNGNSCFWSSASLQHWLQRSPAKNRFVRIFSYNYSYMYIYRNYSSNVVFLTEYVSDRCIVREGRRRREWIKKSHPNPS